MTDFRFSTPLEVRYSDLDAQGHLNHAKYFSFMEQARFKYILALGLWSDTDDFNAVGQIVAEAACAYKRPVMLGQVVEVGVRVSRVGNKSMIMEYEMRVEGEEVAAGRTVQVAYDYSAGQSIPIPPEWRTKIEAFEGE
ncbi:MAG: acyl-CoA thioesterase [Chloroflexi bacterium]|nr:acyl-CoA thioesterase [Chloroflexota bacterium]